MGIPRDPPLPRQRNRRTPATSPTPHCIAAEISRSPATHERSRCAAVVARRMSQARTRLRRSDCVSIRAVSARSQTSWFPYAPALHPSNAEKETIMSIELENMARDLALKGYVSSTQKRYLKRAKHLIERFGRPASELGQEDLRLYVEELRAPGQSASTLSTALCALLFLYRKT